jgi:hypothetical protein
VVSSLADFNTDLISILSKIHAASHFSFSTLAEFKKMMEEVLLILPPLSQSVRLTPPQEFDYLNSPCAFDVEVRVEGEGVEIERVYGSPGFEHPTGGLLCAMNTSASPHAVLAHQCFICRSLTPTLRHALSKGEPAADEGAPHHTSCAYI